MDLLWKGSGIKVLTSRSRGEDEDESLRGGEGAQLASYRIRGNPGTQTAVETFWDCRDPRDSEMLWTLEHLFIIFKKNLY